MITRTAKANVLILGGGFGGLESAFYLRMRLGDRAKISLISSEGKFLFKPNAIYIPFGLDPKKLRFSLDRPMKRRDIELIVNPVREIDPVKRTVFADGHRLSYDYLIVATGAGMRPEEIPGLSDHALTIWTPDDMLRLRIAYQKLLEDAKRGHYTQVLFLIPPNNKCSGPLYEAILMLDSWLRRMGARGKIRLTWSTFEGGYIQAFGPRLDVVVTREFERRGITGYKAYAAEKVEKDNVLYSNGKRLPYDLLISFPPYVASTRYPSLPSDDRGFLITQLETRQVQDYPDIYAAGDAGDFPVKQAFLAFLHADVAAEHLASVILGHEPKASFDPVSMCVMEQFDQATFAQVPLRLTGVPEKPVEVRPGAEDLYRVGTSKAWRLGKKTLGVYLPWRFKAGNPFHAGIPWKGMEIGLKLMSRLMAR